MHKLVTKPCHQLKINFRSADDYDKLPASLGVDISINLKYCHGINHIFNEIDLNKIEIIEIVDICKMGTCVSRYGAIY